MMMKAKGLQGQGNHKPLFELIIEESRRKAWEYNDHHHDYTQDDQSWPWHDEGAMASIIKNHHSLHTNNSFHNHKSNSNNNSSTSSSTSYNSSPASWCRSRSFNGPQNTQQQQHQCCMHSPDHYDFSEPLKKQKHAKISGTWFSRKSKAKALKKAAPNGVGADNLATPRVPLNMGPAEAENVAAWADLIPPISDPNATSSSCLADGGEGYLEVAMALDMMELRLLQTSMQRDAAVAEALELRLAMDALSARLHYLEHCCLQLLHFKPQLSN